MDTTQASVLLQKVAPLIMREIGPRVEPFVAERVVIPLAKKVGLPLARRIGIPIARRTGTALLNKIGYPLINKALGNVNLPGLLDIASGTTKAPSAAKSPAATVPAALVPPTAPTQGKVKTKKARKSLKDLIVKPKKLKEKRPATKNKPVGPVNQAPVTQTPVVNQLPPQIPVHNQTLFNQTPVEQNFNPYTNYTPALFNRRRNN